MRTTLPALVLLLLSACGDDATTTPPAGEGGGDGAGSGGETGGSGAAPATIAWADRTHEQKAAFMQETVMPAMTQLFQEFDSTEFAEVRCSTCHGRNASEVNFHMPNGLHPLNPAAMPSPTSSDANEARWARFMTERVTPRMVELLGVTPWSMENQAGFGCLSCHARAE